MAVVLLVWLVLALLLSLSGALHQVPLPMPMLGGIITVVLLAVLTVASTWRARALELGFRPLIAIHLTRFVGFYFLWLYSLGVLARNFAVPAGWGDVIVAVLAIPLLMMRDGLATRWRTLLIAWNLIGLADILVVVVLAFQMSIADPGFQNAFASLPLSLLPLYIVPLVIASHGVMLYKLAAPGLSTSVRTRTLSMLVAVVGDQRRPALRAGAAVAGTAERDARAVHTCGGQLRLRQARRDDSDARRRQAAHGHPRPQGRARARRSC